MTDKRTLDSEMEKFYSGASDEAKKESEEERLKEEKLDDEAMARLLLNPDFQRIMKRIIRFCGGLFANPFAPSSHIYFNCGKTEVRDWLLRWFLRLNGEIFLKMFKK